jgi:hypothetical protein
MVETERRENDARRERQKETWKTGTKKRNTKETGTKTEIDLGLKAYSKKGRDRAPFFG